MMKKEKPDKKEGKEEKKKGEEKEKKTIKDSLSHISFKRNIIGKLWFRLDYYDRRLMELEEDKQQIFLENYMASTRQLNRSLVLIVIFMIISYMTFAFDVLRFAEALGSWIILAYLLFYMARRHRMQNEELLKFLIDNQVVPEYARFHKKK